MGSKRPCAAQAKDLGGQSLPDSSATARKVIDAPRILAAAPFYLKEHGTPLMPSDLAHHALIIGPADLSPTFSFRMDGRVASVRAESRLTVTITEGAIAGAKAGLGIVASNLDSVRAQLESGALVRILSDWDFGSLEVDALFVNGNTIEPAARVHGFPHRGASTLTSRSIPTGYGYDSFTRMVAEFNY